MKNLFKVVLTLGISLLIVSCCPCKKSKSKDSKPFLGTTWSMVQYEGASFDAKDGYNLLFSEGGKVAGRGDCNRLMGSFTEDGGKLTISKVAGTRMMCPNQEMESKFIEVISTVDAFRVDGVLMSLFVNGEQVAIFEAEATL